MKKYIIVFLLFTPNILFAQLSTNEKPISFNESVMQSVKKSRIKKITMPSLNMSKIEKEDAEDEELGYPPRFGFKHKVSLNLDNSGTWVKLPDGGRLWRLNIACPNALSVNILYDKFWLPDGGKLFIYSKDKSHSIGAFTSRNNKGDKTNVRGFATGLVYGDDVILEYYQPANVTEDAIISLDYVVHGYKYIKLTNVGFGESGSCEVNVNCSEGQDWQKEKKAVAMILVGGNRMCTGSLLNTTELDETPYFLTANHCIEGYGDAVNNPYLDYYSFYWNYEAPGCDNIETEPSAFSTSGATVTANNSSSNAGSDFALLRLSEDPKELTSYTPYYLGWDYSGNSGAPGVCIHHPSGDVKKISTVESQPLSTLKYNLLENNNGHYWKVTWKATTNGHGVTEGGSSGSALLSSSHKVIGQLLGGASSCNNITSPDWYGKFSFSWNGISDNIYMRLDHWLDPNDISVNYYDGLWVIRDTVTVTDTDCQHNHIKISGTGMVTVQDSVNMSHKSMIVEPDGKLIVDGGALINVNLSLKPGATLLIINGGEVKTSHGFEAPTGSIVSVLYGKIE